MSKFTTQYLVCPLSCGISPCSTSPAHWPHHVVDYGKSGILPHSAWRAVRSSWNCRISDTLPYLIIQKIPNVLYGRLVWRIGRPREDYDVFSLQKLYAYSGNIWLSIVLLDCRDVTEVIEWHIPAFSMTMARSLRTCGICSISTSDKTWHFGVACYCPKYKECPYNGHALLITPVHTTPVWWEQYILQGVPQLCKIYM